MQLSTFMYKYSINGLPSPLMQIFARNSDIHTHNTRHREDPVIQKSRYSSLSNSFICRGPYLWSRLPVALKGARSVASFKVQSKKMYLSRYWNHDCSRVSPLDVMGGGWEWLSVYNCECVCCDHFLHRMFNLLLYIRYQLIHNVYYRLHLLNTLF